MNNLDLDIERIDNKNIILNLGPQHPSTHGVLRVLLELDGEVVVKAEPIVGHLHRGIEKMCEARLYQLAFPILDKLDYLAPISNDLAYALAVEKLLQIEIPKRGQYLRVIMNEISRIGSHLIWLGTHALDIGAMSVFLYTFRERELTYDIMEMVTGGRMNVTYIRVGGVKQDVPKEFYKTVKDFIKIQREKLEEYELLLTENPIWIGRTKGVGILSKEDAIALGVTGPLLRGSGIDYDVRKKFPYTSYDDFKFKIPLGKNCDCYDRYLIRLEEIRQSLNIIEQALEGLPEGPINALPGKITLPDKESVYNSIEGLMHHFKLVCDGFKVPEGEAYVGTEAPKGELGFYIVSDGSNKPYRVRIRPPSFINLQALNKMMQGRLLSDIVAVIASIDIVLGEVDR